jgi:hypothetical protein
MACINPEKARALLATASMAWRRPSRAIWMTETLRRGEVQESPFDKLRDQGKTEFKMRGPAAE